MRSADPADSAQVPLAAGQTEAKPVRPWYRSLPLMTKGDIDACILVFSNNLASMLVAVGLIVDKIGEHRTYNYVVPGIAISMLFGCTFYAIQAQLKASQTGRQDLCAQPFGINTPGIFAFAFSIILPVYLEARGSGEVSPEKEEAAQSLAWRVGVLSNFVQGLVEIILSACGPSISKAVPMVALLGSLASIGLTFLFTQSLQGEVFAPIVGFAPFFIVIMAMYSDVKLPRIPSMLPPVLVGTAAAWAIRRKGVTTPDDVSEAMNLLGWHPCMVTFEAFDNFSQVASYLPVVFPVALTVSVGTIQCREVARKVGDEYNLRASMLGDGLATVIAAMCGSPFGMTVFIGHPGFKAMGAKVGYNFLCAFCFVLVCFSGMAGLFKAIFPTQALNPILLFIGLAICSDALEVTPDRHWPALMLSLVPGFANWATTQAINFASGICGKQPGGGCVVSPSGPGAWTLDPTGDLRGLYALGQGYLLTSIYLTSMLIFTIDRHFLKAALWAFLAAVSAAIGLIHSERLFLPWVGPEQPASGSIFDAEQFDLHWNFVAAYMSVCVLFLVCHGLSLKGIIPTGPVQKVGLLHTSFVEEGGLLDDGRTQ
eukprot:TRINITY_DN122303_c0_g1_i1.p1 TRINITY_DN122303_c0_g1~~TRINITY_DN122303_c0_g1_i1.p1  ORF type:complete len:596 (-),score=107.01 TRINITY_DN122303_c0_g1_i1:242-2029(-)